MEGWISLHRKIRKNPIFNDMELLRLWLICLTEATHKERDQPIGRQIVHLEAGQFVTGRFDLVEMYNDGLKRDQQKSPKTVWRWLEVLKNGDFLTINSTNKYSVVTVLNWDKYQSSDHENDHQVTNKRPTNDQQVTTNNKDIISFTTTTTDKPSIDALCRMVFQCNIVPPLITNYLFELREKGYTEVFIQELLLEIGESAKGQPNFRMLKKIGDRWQKDKIYSRYQAKQERDKAQTNVKTYYSLSEREAAVQQKRAEERKQAELIPLDLPPEFEVKEVPTVYDSHTRPTGTL